MPECFFCRGVQLCAWGYQASIDEIEQVDLRVADCPPRSCVVYRSGLPFMLRTESVACSRAGFVGKEGIPLPFVHNKPFHGQI